MFPKFLINFIKQKTTNFDFEKEHSFKKSFLLNFKKYQF